MKAKIVRAAGISYGHNPNRFLIVWFGRHGMIESEYVREGAVYSFAVRPREVYMRVSIAVCEVPEQTEKSSAELFSHVSAGRTQSARSRAVHVLSGCRYELWFMLLGRGTLRGGVCGLSRSLPGAPRIAGGNEFTKA